MQLKATVMSVWPTEDARTVYSLSHRNTSLPSPIVVESYEKYQQGHQYEFVLLTPSTKVDDLNQYPEVRLAVS